MKKALDYLNRILKRKAVTFSHLRLSGAGRFFAPLVSAASTPNCIDRSTLTDPEARLDCNFAFPIPANAPLPNVGIVTLEDAESGRLIEVDTGSAYVRSRFAAQKPQTTGRFPGHPEKSWGWTVFYVENGEPYIAKIREFFPQPGKNRR